MNGIKPLYWFNGKTLFASEIKSIIEHRDYKIDVDLNALNGTLLSKYFHIILF